MRISWPIRSLHLLLIITVVYQLLSSIWMEAPEPGKVVNYEAVLFSWHIMFFGWGGLLVSCVYGVIRFFDPESWQRLVPWFSTEHRAEFFKSAKKEIPDIFRGRLAAPEKKGALAGAAHGLGFLLVIALGMTGSYVMLGIRPDGTMSDDMLMFLDFHELFGILIWTFLAGHILMVFYHLLLGQRRVLDIFERFSIRWK